MYLASAAWRTQRMLGEGHVGCGMEGEGTTGTGGDGKGTRNIFIY